MALGDGLLEAFLRAALSSFLLGDGVRSFLPLADVERSPFLLFDDDPARSSFLPLDDVGRSSFLPPFFEVLGELDLELFNVDLTDFVSDVGLGGASGTGSDLTSGNGSEIQI